MVKRDFVYKIIIQIIFLGVCIECVFDLSGMDGQMLMLQGLKYDLVRIDYDKQIQLKMAISKGMKI